MGLDELTTQAIYHHNDMLLKIILFHMKSGMVRS
jgi:hypothetical protein